MSEGRLTDDGQAVIYPAPSLDGIACEVQHSVGCGEFTKDPGTLGCGVLVMPTGQPRLVIQMKHADGTSLGATLKDALDTSTFISCLLDAAHEAQRIAAEAAAARARPS